MDDTSQLESIFLAALKKQPGAERSAYLDAACQGDSDLRDRVERLLAAHSDAGNFLENPLLNDEATVLHDSTIDQRLGTIIGPYKLLQQIGEGGMGTVFMAEQSVPIQRTVALKIIKRGMDTSQVIARFEAERQALALMDHPNIARVLDAGTTDTGRPYFVMELVKGVPITKYCDEKRLSLRERLKLFLPICRAIQHAHQKGIIHRDLKPTNVLVAEYDNHAVPKVIDFGVAKATSQKLTERTMFTEFGQVIGTVEYMSPEQAKFNQLDIDTRSDIYSLGVLLYELLTGSTPFERHRLHDAAFDEVLRIIREEEPPKPSTRLDTSDTLPSIAANRHTEPARLSKEVRGELDWIVMKCLEKERNRRYETANGLSRDIERYLNDEAVQACPPSAAYRFRKFARRNKVPLFAASAAVAILCLLVAGLATSNRLIASQRAQAEAERKRAQENLLRATVAVRDILFEAAVGRGEWTQLPDVLREKFADKTTSFYQSLLQQESTSPSLQYEIAIGSRSLAFLHGSKQNFSQQEIFARQAVTILDRLAAEYPNSADYRHQQAYCHYVLAMALKNSKRLPEAEKALRHSFDLYQALISQWPQQENAWSELTNCCIALSGLLAQNGASAEVAALTKRLVALIAKQPQAETNMELVAVSYRDLANQLTKAQKEKQALIAATPAVETAQQLAAQQPGSEKIQQLLGTCLRQRGAIYRDLRRFPEGETDLNSAIAIARRLADKFPDADHSAELASCYRNLGLLKHFAGQFEQAEKIYTDALQVQPDNALVHNGLGNLFTTQGKHSQAEVAYRNAFRYMPGNNGYRSNVANSLAAQSKFDQAASEYREVLRLWPRHSLSFYKLGKALTGQGKLPEAEAAYREAIRLRPGYTYRAGLAQVLVLQGRPTEAEAEYREILRAQPDDAGGNNDLAWFLATNAEPNLRNPQQAVEFAKKAVGFAPEVASYWNTLGFAYYRAGDWQMAIEAIEKSLKYGRSRPEPSDYFCLAMANWQLGHKKEAHTWYQKAVAIHGKNQVESEELRRFKAEAAELLAIAVVTPASTASPTTDKPAKAENPISTTPPSTDAQLVK